MSAQAGLTTNPLVWVKAEIDGSIAAARACLTQTAVRGADRAGLLGTCEEHVRQIRGAVQMLALEGPTRFCEAAERAVAALADAPPAGDHLAVSVVDRSLFALSQFVDDLAKGELNVPLKLFPVYRELNELAGRREVAENELFFPDVTVQPPAHPAAHSIDPAALPAHVQACRSVFQRGLLAWLTQPGNRQGLQNMRAALDELDQVAAQLPEPRGLWWAATGLVDALILQEAEALPVPVKPLLGRIERHMREVAGGNAGQGEALLREVLYPLALSRPLSRRMREAKALYALDGHVPEFCVSGTLEYDMSHLAPVLDDMRRRLAAIEDAWAQYTSAQGSGLRELRDQANALRGIARDLGHYRVVKVLDVILLVISRLPDPYPRANEVLALEMAAAFLFIETMLDHFTSPPPDIDRQVAVMVGWLLDAVKPRTGDAAGGVRREDVTQRQNLAQIHAQVAREILANLQQVEQVLDRVARSPGDRAEIASLDHCIRQIAGALKMLGFSRANAVLSACEHLMRLCSEGDPSLIEASLEWVADGLSCLGFYLDALQRGQYPSEALLIGFLERLSRGDARAAGTTGWVPPAHEDELAAESAVPEPDAVPEAESSIATPEPTSGAVQAAPSPAHDHETAELRAVYVEEAHEVLAGIEAMLALLHRSGSDVEALTTVRRSFHTLKGSARMVGLDPLGELAWEVERTLNHWLRESRAATPALLGLIERTMASIAAAVGELERGGTPALAGSAEIADLAAALRRDGAAAPQGAVVAPARPTEVTIGGVRLSATLYDIYLREAAGHLEVLRGALAARGHEPDGTVSQELVRAAHTLKSSSRTTGFAPVADLSATLEELLQLAEGTVLDAPAVAIVGAAVAALTDMIAGIDRGEAPLSADALCRDLQAMVTAMAARRTSGAEDAFEATPLASIVAVSEAAVPAEPPVEEVPADALPEIPFGGLAIHDDPAAVPFTAPETGRHPLPETSVPGEAFVDDSAREPSPEPAAGAPAPEPARIEPFAPAPETGRHAVPGEVPRVSTPLGPEPAVVTAASPDVVHVAAPVAPVHASPPAEAGVDEDLDPQVLPVFFEEAAQLLPQIGADLASWRESPAEIAPARSLARALHTLKGSARMTGAMRLGELTHAVESRVGMALESGEFGGPLFDELQHDIDRIAEQVDLLQARGTDLQAPASAPAETYPAAPGSPLAAVAATLRVDAEVLDRLVNQAGEMSIARARIDGEMDTFKQSLLDLTDSVARLRTQLREMQIQADSQMQSRMSEVQRDARQFDPLEFDRYTRLQELARLMAESLHDVQSVQQTLLANLGETEGALVQQGRVTRDLQQELVRLRSVPFGLLAERLQRTVRQAARQLGKTVAFAIEGIALEMDRNVLQRIAAPLEHMVRNAVAHGIEEPQARRARGKAETGRIVLTLQQEGNQHVIALADDGAGLDLDRIRREALRMGLVEAGTQLTDAQAAQLIFAPGFSTADELTQTAGRGVGMDVVRSEVGAAGGRVEVLSTSGEGTAFRIFLPLTLAASQALLVRAAGATYAIGSQLVEQVHEIRPEDLASAYRAGSLDWNEAAYPLFYLPRLLGQRERIAEIQRRNVVLLLRSGDLRAAIHIDQILRNQEIVLKQVGPQLGRVPGVAGATVLGNGQVVLILNPLQLATRAQASEPGSGAYTRVVADERPKPLVMVVDDSLTVRRLTGRLFAREGYRVATAKDGVDALQQLQDVAPDLLVLDIEMPRMDGFELTKHLRSDPRTADVPIVIVTSRTADKHRRHALELGANAFFGKPYQEDELLAAVAGLLGEAAPAQAA